ncbi:MAG: SDR family NAD(P)-dependent oxidoreductase [Aphanocapsa sp. GSE-SYN-MK-11-07L]|nr:SDR family NAD(P)-dependent oxidoreductase [Aphanocapsa sp. GSE-SYN-MK-11-07L]
MSKKTVGINRINDQLQQTPIAIVGMASIFPQSLNLQEYWETIIRKLDCITDVPASRWDVNTYYDPDPKAPDKTYCNRGGFIPEIDFNPMEFGLPPNILEVTDISQLLALAVAKTAMEDAGYGESRQYSHERTGVVLGVALARQLSMPLASRLEYPIWEKALKSSGLSDQDTQIIVEKIKSAYVQWEENAFPGMLANVVAGRIANRLDFGGMNCVVDAACASSLGALKMSISELVEGRSDMMLTGGVDTDNSIVAYMCFSKTPAVSKGDKVRPFDADSDGMMLGEGVGMLVLKRLADAERDGDRIYAVVRGIGASSDGRYKSIYAPRPEGQVNALRRAYEDAGVSPTTVGLIEAHGTGTMAGDPTEVTALKAFFGEYETKNQQIALGSVKSQIGHTKAAAGAASLIKAALALHHKVLPPTINVTQPHPKLQLESSPFYLNTETRPWIHSDLAEPRRAGVSSFGFGGTNYHVVLEEYEGEHDRPYRLHQPDQSVLVNAPTVEELTARCEQLGLQLESETGEQEYQALIEASQAIAIPTSDARIGFVASSLSQARSLLKTSLTWLRKMGAAESWEHPQGIYYRKAGMVTEGKVVALFSGQGSQYLEMGREMVINFPTLRQTFTDLDRLLLNDGLQSLSETVFPPPVFDPEARQAQVARLQQTEYAQPAIGAISAGLYKILQQGGFKPDFIAGHSFGELTALWANQALSDEDYFFLVKARGQAMATPKDAKFDAGAMLAVEGDVTQIESVIKEFQRISVANWNSPRQVVLAGAKPEIAKVEQVLTERGFSTVLLPVSAAFHTPLVAHAQQPFAQAVESVTFRQTAVPVYSNVTGKRYPSEPQAIQKILKEQLLNSVLFKDEIENIYADGGYFFVEFGPRSILTNLVKEILGDRPHLAVALNGSRQKDSDRQLREAVVQLRVAGLPLQACDPFQLGQKMTQAPKNSALNVRLSSVNLAEKTKMNFEQALQNGHRVQLADSKTTQAEPIETVPEPTLSNAAPGNTKDLQPVARQDTFQKLANAVDPHPVLGSIEQTLTQFNHHQSDVLQAHTQALQSQTEYAKIFFQLMQQQQSLFGSSQFAQPEAEIKREILQSSERSMMQFHHHQAETLQIHEQFLNHEMEYNNQFFQLVKEQYGLLLQGDFAALNGHSIDQPTDYEFEALPPISHSQLEAELKTRNGSSNGNGHGNGNGHANGHTVVEDYKSVQEHLVAIASPKTQPPEVSVPVKLESAPVEEISPIEKTEEVAAVALATVDIEQLTQTLLGIVSDKTGYPADMLELQMDMEADLGIDSIKRVEILGTLMDLYPGLPQPNPDELAELRSLEQIAEYIHTLLAQPPAPSQVADSASSAAPAAANPIAEVAEPKAPELVSAQNRAEDLAEAVEAAEDINDIEDIDDILQTLLAVVSEQTGYPPEMLGMDMAIDADLGIDAVKLVEIIDDLLERCPDLTQPTSEQLTELSTLSQLLAWIKAPEADSTTDPNPSPQPAESNPELDSKILRSPVKLKALPEPDYLDFTLPAGHICLLSDDGSPTTQKLAQALTEWGWQTVVLSFPGVATSALPQPVNRVSLADFSEEHLQQQLAAIAATHGSISAFIHLHPVSQANQAGQICFQDSDAALLKQVFLIAKHLKDPLNQAAGQGRSCFMTVARLDGEFGLGQQINFSVIPSGLFGLTKTLNQEWQAVFCRAIDLHPDLSAQQSVKAIWDELHDPNCLLTEVGYSLQGRSTLVCEPAALVPVNSRINQASVFLVSGGGKGITAQCVVEIAKQHKCKFILLGRSVHSEAEPIWAAGYESEADLKKQIIDRLTLEGKKVTPLMVQAEFNVIASQREITKTLAAIAQVGGEAEYLSVDVTDLAALRTELSPLIERLGPVTGIIHGAGNLADKRIEKKSERDFDTVYNAKVKGLENLLSCVSANQLHQLILFSSVVGFYGNVGQSDYAIANEILNKSAHLLKQHSPNCHAVAINWGPWEGGMVSPELKKAFAERQIDLIPLQTGTQMLVNELAAETPQVLIGSPLVHVPEKLDPSLKSFQIRRRLTLEKNPFLQDHVIAGHAVLPATCALTWMINICEQFYPGYRFFHCQNYKVLKGIIFDENLANEYILDVQEIDKTSPGSIECEVKIWSQNQDGKVRYHFSTRVLLQQQTPTAPIHQGLQLIQDQSFTELSHPFYQNGAGSLFHGPSFQGITAILNASSERLTAECLLPSLSARQQGQFPLQTVNPFIADVQIQSTWVLLQHLCQQGCLPAGIERFEHFAPIPFDTLFYVSTEIKSRKKTTIIADVISHDREGRIYTQMIGAKATVLPSALELRSKITYESLISKGATAKVVPV